MIINSSPISIDSMLDGVFPWPVPVHHPIISLLALSHLLTAAAWRILGERYSMDR